MVISHSYGKLPEARARKYGKPQHWTIPSTINSLWRHVKTISNLEIYDLVCQTMSVVRTWQSSWIQRRGALQAIAGHAQARRVLPALRSHWWQGPIFKPGTVFFISSTIYKGFTGDCGRWLEIGRKDYGRWPGRQPRCWFAEFKSSPISLDLKIPDRDGRTHQVGNQWNLWHTEFLSWDIMGYHGIITR